MAQSAPTQIDIKALTKTFQSKQGPARALDAVDLTIEPGELFFLLGPSGCGKTTLLRSIAGFERPESGTIAFVSGTESRVVSTLPPGKRNTAMVFQSYALWPHMTVRQNVAYGLKVRKVPGTERDARINEALAAVRMTDYADRKPTQLSGGQQQRVALARALVVRPDVLLLDEPLSNLDAALRAELRREIRRVCKEAGFTAVYVTHDQAEALSTADRIALMRDGRIVQLGTPDDLYHNPKSAFAANFLGEANLIPATITETAPTTISAEALGARFEIPTERAHLSAPTAGQKCHLCCRPEAVSIAEDENLSNTIQTTLGHTDFHGGSTLTTASTTDGYEFRSLTLGYARHTAGTQASLSIDPDQITLLDPASA